MKFRTLAIQVALCVVLPLAALEVWVRHELFDVVSYTNSVNLDEQLRNFRARDDWNIIAIGSSEVRWGLMPSEIDKAMSEQGLAPHSFNFAMDGFPTGLYYALMPGLDFKRKAPNLRAILIGVNLVEGQKIFEVSDSEPFRCSALQRPVLTSPFGIDHGFHRLCEKARWTQGLADPVEAGLRFLRYRKALRAALLGQGRGEGFIPFQSNGLPHHPDGFQPHKSIAEDRANYEGSWERFLASREHSPKAFAPMDPEIWNALVAEGGFFDRWLAYGRSLGVEVIFYALPTNPLLIDTTDRREDYGRNSRLLARWAAQRGVSYIDLGIQDGLDPERDFSDRRHLSVHGAPKFSAALGAALARDPRLIEALER